MKPFVDIIIETTNQTAALNRLHSLGLEKGNGIKLYTRAIESVANLFYFTFRVWSDRVHVIPDNYNATFTVVWRSDVFDEDGHRLPMPDINLLTGTTQGAVEIS